MGIKKLYVLYKGKMSLRKWEIAVVNQLTGTISILSSSFPQQELGLAVLDDDKQKFFPLTAM